MSAIETASNLELVLTRLIAVPRDKLYRCWTEPTLLKQRFTPPPFTVTHAEMDVRVGGASLVMMRGPDGTEFPSRGVYLDVVPNERLVFTDAYVRAWEPSPKPFMTGILTFGDEDGKTRYTVCLRHWTEADREAHEQMGFHQGWAVATDQLTVLAGSGAVGKSDRQDRPLVARTTRA